MVSKNLKKYEKRKKKKNAARNYNSQKPFTLYEKKKQKQQTFERRKQKYSIDLVVWKRSKAKSKWTKKPKRPK